MSTLDRMRINLEGIGHALSDKKLQVPVYQRDYAWQKDHVKELFQDIGSAINDGTAEYFVGSIVVSSKGTDRPEVVDGQQRLATTTILLAAIRDYFFTTGDTDRAYDLERRYLKERDLRTQEEVPRLRLNEIDDNFFRKRVLATPGSTERNIEPNGESHELITQAASLAERIGASNAIFPAASLRASLRKLAAGAARRDGRRSHGCTVGKGLGPR